MQGESLMFGNMEQNIKGSLMRFGWIREGSGMRNQYYGIVS